MKRVLLAFAVTLVVLAALGAAVVYRWTVTPHGRLDPEMALMLRMVPPLTAGEGIPIAAQREALRRNVKRDPFRPVDLHQVDDREMPGPGGPLRLRVYRPSARRGLPVTVYYHGGGFNLGDLDTHDRICRELASRSGSTVVAVDYRLAPEHPFPAAVDDAYAALGWVHAHAGEIDVDPRRVAVAGDSAGGNLAAVVALKARDEATIPLAFQLLVYPATDLSSFGTRSHEDFKEGFLLTRQFAVAMRRGYLPNPAERRQPYASPLLAPDLRGLPPALVITAQFDPLRDEGEAYARRLAAAGVRVTTIRYDGVTHGFFGVSILRKGRRAIEDAARALREAFGNVAD